MGMVYATTVAQAPFLAFVRSEQTAPIADRALPVVEEVERPYGQV